MKASLNGAGRASLMKEFNAMDIFLIAMRRSDLVASVEAIPLLIKGNRQAGGSPTRFNS